ncbi:MAG: hypothetical protein Q8Q20_00360 [bacterium]|nr:hypothetical protein [bacterium]
MVTIVVGLVVTLAMIGFGFVPLYFGITDQSLALSEKRLDLALLQSQLKQSEQSDNESALKELDDDLNNYFIDRSEFLEFISTIEDLATEYAVAQTIELSEFPETEQLVFEHPINVMLSGRFDQVLGMVDEMENQGYYLNFETVNVSRGGSLPSIDSGDTTAIKLSLSGKSFWRQQP